MRSLVWILLFLLPITAASAWNQCGGSPPYEKNCYQYTSHGDAKAHLGTYYDFNCNSTRPGVGCGAYGQPLCRTCTFENHTKSHGKCPLIWCLNSNQTFVKAIAHEIAAKNPGFSSGQRTVALGKHDVAKPVTIGAEKAAAPVSSAQADTTLYKVSNGECGQATLDAKYAAAAEKFAGLQEGSCSSVGYTVAAGTKALTVPVLGQITISLFKKADTEATQQQAELDLQKLREFLHDADINLDNTLDEAWAKASEAAAMPIDDKHVDIVSKGRNGLNSKPSLKKFSFGAEKPLELDLNLGKLLKGWKGIKMEMQEPSKQPVKNWDGLKMKLAAVKPLNGLKQIAAEAAALEAKSLDNLKDKLTGLKSWTDANDELVFPAEPVAEPTTKDVTIDLDKLLDPF